ncbi:HAD family hydrolase [Streptomyces mexicanus]|uniref:HAD family hydrolase n=1 Tax=Streptomyces mexicanus TaxID=178566 RepID=UPI0036D0DE64
MSGAAPRRRARTGTRTDAAPRTVPDAVLFDLDGTLADTPAAIGRLLAEVCAEAGRPVAAADAAATVGIPLEDAFARLLALPAHAAPVAEAVRRYRSLFDARVPAQGPRLAYPGVAEGLARLTAAGIPLAITTSKVTRSAHALLTAMGLDRHFTVVVGHDRVRHGKPDPATALLAAQECGVPAAGCVVVGDAVVDVSMARAAGMRPVAVAYGVGSRPDLAAAGAAVCADFDEVVAALLPRADARKEEERCPSRAAG